MSRVQAKTFHFTLTLPVLFVLACAGRNPLPENPDSLPHFKEFPTSVEILTNASIAALRYSPYHLEPDLRHSSPGGVITLHRTLSMKELRRLAYRGAPSVHGKPIHADFHVQLTIRSSYAQANMSRVTVQPIFMVYISRFRDHRQWIQWRSNGILEAELLQDIEAQLHGGNWD